MPAPLRSPFAVASQTAVVGAVFLLPLLLGGALPGALWALLVLSVLAAGCALQVGRQEQSDRLRLPLGAWALLGVALICLAQLVPLPRPVLSVFSTRAAELADFLELTGARPVSLDPSATWRELSKHLSYACLCAAAGLLAYSRTRRQRLLAAVALSGGLVSAIGLFHRALSLSSLFGLFPFREARPPLLTPFGNPNHLAGFLTLTAPVALALALQPPAGVRRAWFLAAYGASAAAVVLSLSRGGLAFFVLTQVGTVLWLGFFRAPSGEPVPARPRWPLYLGAALLPVLAVAYAAFDRVWAEARSLAGAQELAASKVGLFPRFLEAALAHPVLGMGRGAFAAGFSPFQDQLPWATLTHPESWPLQLLAELGLLPTLLLVAVLAAGIRVALRRDAPSPPELGALAGLLGLCLHDVFDFALELPASAAAASVVAGVLMRAHRQQGPLHPVLPGRVAVRGLVGLAVFSALGLFAGRLTAEDDAQALQTLRQGKAPPAVLEERFQDAVARHPADYRLQLERGLAELNPARALPYFNRALYLRPLDSQAHAATARSLLALNQRLQAFGEFRLAVAGAAEKGPLRTEAVAAARTLPELWALCGSSALEAEDVGVTLERAGRSAQAAELLERALDELSGEPGLASLALHAAHLRLREGELEAAEKLLTRAEEEGAGGRALLTRAELLRAGGKVDQALALLEARVPLEPANGELGFALAQTLLFAQMPQRARQALSRLKPFLQGNGDRVRLITLEAQALAMEGRVLQAVAAYQTAARLTPESPQPLYAAAKLYEGTDRLEQALQAVMEGLRVERGDPAPIRAWAETLRARINARPAPPKPLNDPEPGALYPVEE